MAGESNKHYPKLPDSRGRLSVACKSGTCGLSQDFTQLAKCCHDLADYLSSAAKRGQSHCENNLLEKN